MVRALIYIGVTIICVLLVSCQARPALWIVQGSTIDNLVFGVSEKKGIDASIVVEKIYVYRGSSGGSENPPYRSENLIWAAVKNDQELRSPISRIRYGDSPKGLNVITDPQPLEVYAYYQARVYFRDDKNNMHAPSVVFWISEQGRIEESLMK